MARRIRTLTVERVGDLPGPCLSCALWETGVLRALECGPSDEREKLEAWVGKVRSQWGDCGRIAYEDGEPLGFIKYAPPAYFPRVHHMPSGPPDDDAVLIACLHVDPKARDAGLGKVLLQAAFRDLVSRGEKAVQAYATSSVMDRERSPLMSVEFLSRQGFTVARPHPQYPLMRLELKSLAKWAESLEAMLEALQIPRRVKDHVPAPLINARMGKAGK